MDKFAKIAAEGMNVNDKRLITPQPVSAGDEMIEMKPCVDKKPYLCEKKMDSKEELMQELAQMRRRYQPYLRNYAPALKSLRTRRDMKEFSWQLEGSEETMQVQIPHYGGPLGNAAAYYRTEFEAPRLSDSEALFLVFKGADYKAQVFVNGVYIGEHEGFFAPFEFDITDHIKPGQKNMLEIKLLNDYIFDGNTTETDETIKYGDKMYAATGLGYDDPQFGWHHCPPGMGIYNSVYTEVRNRVHLNDIFVRSTEDGAEVWAEVYNCDYTPCKISFLSSVYGQNFEQTVCENIPYKPLTSRNIGVGDTFTEVSSRQNGTIDQPVEMYAYKGINRYRFKIMMDAVKLWSPETPYLYQIQLQLFDEEGHVLDNMKRQFGIRKFIQDLENSPKGMFYLNGEKIRLRGANTMGFEQQCVLRGDFDRLVDDILLAKICHMNFWRLTQRPVQEEIYDYCDMLGLMTQTDLPLFGSLKRTSYCEAIKQAEEMERLIRSHACNVIISYMNEPSPNAANKPQTNLNRHELQEFFKAADSVVLMHNPDRVIKHVDGDYDPPSEKMPDNHCYPMWYNGHGIDVGKLHKGYWMLVMPDWYYGCGEFGAEGLECAEVMKQYYPKSWLKQPFDPANIIGAQTAVFHHFFYDTQDNMEDWIRESQEHQAFATRIMTEAFRRQPLMVSFAIHLFIDAFPSGWMKTIMDFKRNPKQAYFEYRNALAPVLLSLRTDRFAYFDNENMKVECFVCNDTNKNYSDCKIRYELICENRVLAEGASLAKTKPCDVCANGTITYSFKKIPKRKQYKLAAYLLQDDKVIASNELEFNVYPYKSLPDKAFHVCAIEEIKESMADDVKHGATLFITANQDGKYDVFGKSVFVRECGMLPVHFVSRKTGHPWVSEFTPYDFKFWYSRKMDRITPISKYTFTGDDFSPVLTSANLNDDGEWEKVMVIGEFKHGKGRVIVSTINIDFMLENPAGRYLFCNMLTVM